MRIIRMDACYGLPGKDSPSLAGCMCGNHLKIFFSNLFSVIFFSCKTRRKRKFIYPWVSHLVVTAVATDLEKIVSS